MIAKNTMFGRLKVIKSCNPPENVKYTTHKWYECECTCEKKTKVITTEYALIHGKCTSCGCYKSEKAKQQIEINRLKMIQNGNSTRKKDTKYYEYKGVKKTCSQWAIVFGISRQTLYNKLKKTSFEEIVKQYKGD